MVSANATDPELEELREIVRRHRRAEENNRDRSIGPNSADSEKMEFIITLPSVMICLQMYSLMLHVPAIIHTRSSFAASTAIAQASMSNIPPATGVPALSPVNAATSLVMYPHISVEFFMGGSISRANFIPKRSSSFSSYFFVCKFRRFAPE